MKKILLFLSLFLSHIISATSIRLIVGLNGKLIADTTVKNHEGIIFCRMPQKDFESIKNTLSSNWHVIPEDWLWEKWSEEDLNSFSLDPAETSLYTKLFFYHKDTVTLWAPFFHGMPDFFGKNSCISSKHQYNFLQFSILKSVPRGYLKKIKNAIQLTYQTPDQEIEIKEGRIYIKNKTFQDTFREDREGDDAEKDSHKYSTVVPMGVALDPLPGLKFKFMLVED